MRIVRTISCALLAILLLPAALLAGRGDELVHASLVADVSAIQPGESFRLGVAVKIDPSWHIYWKNPGDSGLPTRVKLDLPAGFTAGEVQFPVPRKLTLPGDIVNYGYEDQTMLIVPVSVAKDVAIGSTANLKAKISWLVCQEMCLPGKADVEITLPVAAQAQPVNREAFDQWSKQMPERDAREYVDEPWLVRSGNRQFEFKLSWKRAVTDVDWWPGNNDPLTVRGVKVQTRDGATLLSFGVQAVDVPHPPDLVRSLLVFTLDGQRHAAKLNIPLPKGWAAAEASSVSK
ncbi:MAG TPA: protein-disulfide reductase DsbD domain-containing protein [Tepidisphaeraceae bacterium]|nr:protein-disulfide reductase DsbD domain-containing protein [Tepidisphaeraceae bacterium]